MGLALDAVEKYEEAIGYYERALAINPSQTDIRNWYSDALDTVGRETDAMLEMEKAYELDPLSVLTLNNYTSELVSRRDFDQAAPVLERLSQVDPARGASFRSFILSEQHREAEGAVEMFRGADIDPGSLRVRSQAAYTLLGLALADDALQVWPYPDLLQIVADSGDDDYALELARKKYENDPGDPANTESLAWAYWSVGEKEQALKFARRYLDTLEPVRQQIDGANWMFVLDAWLRDDGESMLTFLVPLEADINNAMESGIDNTFMHYGKAIAFFMKGETGRSLEHLDIALSRGMIAPARLDDNYENLGWNALPEYVERRQKYEKYRTEERQKFLRVACGPDGFSTWQPSPETCAEVETI